MWLQGPADQSERPPRVTRLNDQSQFETDITYFKSTERAQEVLALSAMVTPDYVIFKIKQLNLIQLI